jgi:membrane protease YdiL (CAAX protease family)
VIAAPERTVDAMAASRVGADPAGGAWILVPAGLSLLLIRPLFAFEAGGVWLLTATYLALGLASALAMRSTPLESGGRSGEGSLPVMAGALAVGLGALGLAVAGQRTIHVSVGPVALSLTALASVAEEAFFRGFLYQRLARRGVPIAIVASAAAFALIHVLAYPPAAVWVDFGAGLMFGWQRWVTGSWLVPAGTHLAANLLVVMS